MLNELWEKLVAGGVISTIVALLLERVRHFYKRQDKRQDEAAEQKRRVDGFGTLLNAARQWRRRARLCLQLHDAHDPALGYALRDHVDGMDLTPWEKHPEALSEKVPPEPPASA